MALRFLFFGISGSLRRLRSPVHGCVGVPQNGGPFLFSFTVGGPLTGPATSPVISQSVSGSLLEDVGDSSSTSTS